MPGLAMEPNQANARPSRTSRSNAAAAATNSVVKQEAVDDDATYRSRPQLPVPLTLKRNLAELMKLMDSGVVDVDPDYQREVVWTADRMTGLINSLMENFYIPPIILNKKPRRGQDAAAPQETFVCVDGKQRLSSVMAFIKGMIPCHDHRGEKWWFCEPAGNKRKRVFSEQVQRQFFQKDFISFEYNNLSPEQEEDLFARVQMGVQLNLAEKMRASTGPWQELASLFVEDFPSVYYLMKDRARSKGFQLTLSCFSQILECMHPTAANGVPTLKTNHTHLPKLLDNKGAVDDGLKSHLASVWNTLKDLIDKDSDTFTNGNKYLRGVQTFAPIEMVAVTVLISTHSDTRNNRLLLGDIQAMRTAVRENFVDLRMNASLWKWFWEYIDELEAIRGTIDGNTVDRSTKQREKRKEKISAHQVASGSTAAAISAAAAAPKKGRFTARTKRPAATAEEEVPVAVKQEQVTVRMPVDPPPSKRQRTGEDQPTGSPLSNEQPRPSLSGTATSSTVQHVGGIDHDLLLHSMPTHALTQSPPPVARIAFQRPNQTSFVPPTTAPSHTTSNPIRTENHQAYPSTPSEVRQRRVSALGSFQYAQRPAPPTPNGVPAVRGQFTGMTQVAYPPMPVHEEALWKGVLGSAAPKAQAAIHTSELPHPHAMQRARVGQFRPMQEKSDEVIDLTSDTEQERLDLLSSFKAKPLASTPVHETSKPAAEPAAQKRIPTAKEPRSLSHELPSREDNPDARFKNG